MGEDGALLTLIGRIYDAALDTSLWPSTLAEAAALVGGRAAAVSSLDASLREGRCHFDGGRLDPEYTRLFFSTYVKLSPTAAMVHLAPIGEPVSRAEMIPIEELRATRFYREWVAPQGWADVMAVVLERSAKTLTLFNVFFHEHDPPPDAVGRERIRLLGPHLLRSVSISRTLLRASTESCALAEALDGLAAAMLLVDGNGRIVHANRAGLRLIESGAVLGAQGGRILAAEHSATETLLAALGAAGSGGTSLGSLGIAVPLVGRDGSRQLAHVLPLAAGRRRPAGAGHAAVAAIFVEPGDRDGTSAPAALAELYGLTPAELRVLLAVVQIDGVAATAETLGLAESTVKTHLKRIFAKTGAARQADLVRLLARHASPLAQG